MLKSKQTIRMIKSTINSHIRIPQTADRFLNYTRDY